MPSSVTKIAFADSLRGIACLAVVISHLFGNFWLARALVAGLINAPVLPDSVATPRLVLWLHTAVPVFSWAAFGIGLFFLVSGFVIPFSLVRLSRTGFIVARLLRIYPTYAAGFSVTLLSLLLTGILYGRPFPYTIGHVAAHFIPVLRETLWFSSIDGIVWTLEIELKFYVLCALFAPLLRNPRWPLALVPLVLTIGYAASASYAQLPWGVTALSIAIYRLEVPFVIFMCIGVALNLSYRGKTGPWLTAALIGLLLTAFFYGCGFTPYYIPYCAALLLFVGGFLLREWWPEDPVLGFLARISYPLYVVHPILGYALLRLLLEHGWGTYSSLAMASAAVLAAAYLIHRLVERPTHRLGRALGTRLSARSARVGEILDPARG